MDIKIHKVAKSFGGRAVLRDVNLRIRAGERWQLCGASGIGKTTLLRILMGLEKADSGQIIGMEQVRVTACFQEQRLCKWLTARQNLRLVCGQEVSHQEMTDALCALLPADALDRAASTLSGGMQRRIALARALLPQSELVVLDEPFAGLDAENAAAAVRFIERYRRARAVVLVSHEVKMPEHEYQIFTL